MKNERDEVFRIARTFDANINTIFDLWTEPKHLSKWLGPKGSKCTYLKSELKVGGTSHYCMTGHDGSKMWGKVIYKEIVRPSRLTYIQCFSDENEGISQHPMAPDFPAQMLTTVTFEAEGEKTIAELTGKPAKTP